ncbi:hypothetical protein [Maricaulis sp.]|uniref:hypothetical protein n=1 Tax=Maricaulis sp. TaxID=1486257 RepID=UPI000C4F9C10|nr:hypothetical protein [Maricaulis sp.]MAC89316.1 hypothetical protein [Maricaulis sp.]
MFNSLVVRAVFGGAFLVIGYILFFIIQERLGEGILTSSVFVDKMALAIIIGNAIFFIKSDDQDKKRRYFRYILASVVISQSATCFAIIYTVFS